ncbi:hypothetical protein [Pseudomonas bohemica]|uniref:hypothetical protein n=1 Tax=Pseudomonas bohemica TaxID=2044872 RepID=UPI001F2DE8B0|nr:hypothetical protein [Pseudomonas bohemica]
MFKDILALALRGHTRFKEQRCLVSRVFNNYTVYNPYSSTLDMATKLEQGLAAHSLPARMFAMLILGIFASVFSDGVLRVFRNVSEMLAYRFPFDKKKLIKGLLESDIADYEIELLHKQKSWPMQGVAIWRSC